MESKEVLFKLRVDSSDASRGVKKAAEDTRALSEEAKGAQKELDRMDAARKKFSHDEFKKNIQSDVLRMRDPVADARRQLQDQRYQERVGLEQWKMTPAGRRSMLPPGVAGRAAMAAAPYAAGLYIGGQIVSAQSAAVNDMGAEAAFRAGHGGGTVSGNEVVNSFVRHLAESIPILGGIVKSFGDLATASGKITANIYAAGLQKIQRQGDVFRFGLQQEGAATRELYPLRMQAVDARAEADAKAALVRSLTPGRLAELSGPYGDLKEQSMAAEAAAAAARQGLAARQQDLAAARADYDKAGRGNRLFGRIADADLAAGDAATREKERWMAQSGNTQVQTTSKRLDAQESRAMMAAGASADSAKTASVNLEEKANRVKQALVGVSEQQVKVIQQETAARMALLAQTQRMVAENVSGAIAAGRADPAMRATQRILAERFEKSGLAGMAPEQIAALPPELNELVNDAAKRRDAADPNGNAIRALKGRMTGQGINSLPLDQQEADSKRATRETEAQDASLRAGVAERAGREIADVVWSVMRSAIAAMKRELDAKVQSEVLMKKGQ